MKNCHLHLSNCTRSLCAAALRTRAENCQGTTILPTYSDLSDCKCTKFRYSRKSLSVPAQRFFGLCTTTVTPFARPNSAPKNYLRRWVVPHDAHPPRTHAPTAALGKNRHRRAGVRRCAGRALPAIPLPVPGPHVVDSKGYGPSATWMDRSRECSR